MMTKGFDFLFFWNLTRRNWICLLLAGIVAATLAFLVSKCHLKRLYESNVSLYVGRVVEEGPAPQLPANVNPQLTTLRSLNTELVLGEMLINDYTKIIQSRKVRAQVEKKLQEEHPDEPHGYSVRVESKEKSHTLDIFVQADTPEMAQYIAGVIAESFITESKELMQIANAKIIDEPTKPTMPCYPNIRKNTFGGFLVGVAIAWLICFLKTVFDTKIYSTEELQELVSLPIIGVIPQDSKNADGTAKSGEQIVALRSGCNDRLNLGEAFRNLRTNLQYFDVREKNQAKLFVITSSLPGEGKTFNSANIAFSMAEVGKKTLVINCDLRKPSLGNTLGITSEKGIVSVLVGECSFDEAVVRNLRNLPLDALLCGPIPPTPSRLLLSDEFKKLLADLRTQYDYIFIDVPPSLGLADASIIGALSDGVVLVVQAARTQKEDLVRTSDQLKQLNINLVGMVFNRFSTKNSSYYASGDGKYWYGYTQRPRKWYEKFNPFHHRHTSLHENSEKH